jgi:hypothetical protein
MIAIRWHHLPQFRRGKRNCVIRAGELTHRLAGIAGHAGWNIDGHYLSQRESAVNLADGFERPPRRRSADASAKQSIDHQRGVARPRGNFGFHRATACEQHAVIRRRIAPEVLRGAEYHDIERSRMDARRQLPRHYHPVAAIIALSA